MKTLLETDGDYICEIDAPCFQMLTLEEAGVVQASRTQVLFRKGDHLTKQGAFASYILFMIKGLAIQYLEGDGVRNFNLRIIQPGEFIGLSAIFTKNTFNYSSVALSDCQVYLVEKDAVAKVVMENGMFAYNMTRRYFEQNSNLYDSLRTLMYKQMNGRLAESLLYLGGLKPEFPDIFQLLSRRDLADFAGISTESAVKLLKGFEKDGLIELQDKDIRLLKLDTLQEISRRG
jgi:CRP/FNR family transcriptional regulator